jgi:phage-related protein
MPALQSLWATVQTQVLPALRDFASAVAPIIAWLVDKLAPIVANVFAGIVNVVKAALTMLSGVINVITGMMTGDWQKVWDGWKQIASGAFEALKTLVTTSFNVIKGIFSGALDLIKLVWARLWGDLRSGTAKDLADLSSAVRTGIAAVVKWFSDLPNTVKNLFSKAGDWLLDAGRNLVSGFQRGISNAWGAFTGWIQTQMNKIPAAVRQVLGISSPSRVFVEIGRQTGEGLTVGLDSTQGQVRRAATGLVDAPAASLIPRPRAAGLTEAAAVGATATVGQAPAGGTHYHFAAGSIVLDASKIRDLQGLLDMLDGVRSTARQYGAVPVGA